MVDKLLKFNSSVYRNIRKKVLKKADLKNQVKIQVNLHHSLLQIICRLFFKEKQIY